MIDEDHGILESTAEVVVLLTKFLELAAEVFRVLSVVCCVCGGLRFGFEC